MMKQLDRDFNDILDEDLYCKNSILYNGSKFFTEFYYSIRNFIKYKIILKLKYKIDTRETWELDVIITKYIVNILKNLEAHSELKKFNDIIIALEKYINDDDYSNYQDAEISYHELYKLLGHELIVPHHNKFINFIVPRLEYLKAHNSGHPGYTAQKLKKKKLMAYYNESQELQWELIQSAMIDKFKSESDEDREEAFRILTEVVFNLWD